MKHEPATPLPWRLLVSGPTLRPDTVEISPPPPAELGGKGAVVGWSGFDNSDLRRCDHRDNAAYIVHAANAYPKLIEMLQHYVKYHDKRMEAESLLRDLGEIRRVGGRSHG